ncbi:MAG: (2Fe-2S)-binding protein [Anaerolineales bacterium]|nr:(2Fe-2S)-binding protein [Anaerolineales bacterium]
MRLTKTTSHLSAYRRGKSIEVTIDGQKVQAFEGELVSTVLQAEGISVFGRKHSTGRPSGVYCGMGVCYECLVTINGINNIQACQTFAADQMEIETTIQVEQ